MSQRPDVVHDRVLQLANRLRDDAPPVEAGDELATLLGITGSLEIQVADRGPSRIDLQTTRGRILALAEADIVANGADQTSLTITVTAQPQGFAANMMLGVALSARPQIRQGLESGMERGMDELALELAKPDDQWDPGAWMPQGLPVRG